MSTSSNSFFCNVQGRPAPLDIMSEKCAHIRSLANALKLVHTSIDYVKESLTCLDDDWDTDMQYDIARELVTLTMLLSSTLDGLVQVDIHEEMDITSIDPFYYDQKDATFLKTPLTNIRLRSLQEKCKEFKSYELERDDHSGQKVMDQPVFIDFWSITDFWKVYFPSNQTPQMLKNGIRDFYVGIWNEYKSGPIMHDLIIPTYNIAYEICTSMMKMVNERVDRSNMERL